MMTEDHKSPAPLGVPLGQLQRNLEEQGRFGKIKNGDTLVLPLDNYSTEVRVRPVGDTHSSPDPVQARVSVVSTFEPGLAEGLGDHKVLMDFNGFASLGSLTNGESSVAVESALTVFEGERAWATLQQPLIEAAVLYSAGGILGAIRRSAADEPGEQGASAWTRADFVAVESMLSRMCVCNADDSGLTAEFGVAQGSTTALLGHHNTALYQQMPGQSHPHLGGGLLCQIEMPQRYSDAETLAEVCARLNVLEMTTIDQPPHFGAWCEGRLGGNPAYVTFLPNGLHGVSRIALNEAIWALNRAQWAHARITEFAGGANGLKPNG